MGFLSVSLHRYTIVSSVMTNANSFIENDSIEESAAYRSLLRFYGAEERYSASGDEIDRVSLLETLHPDIVLYQPESLPYGGVWRGREAFGKWLDAMVLAWTGIKPVDPVFYDCGNGILISLVTLRASARSTRIEIAMPMCQVIRFSNDLPIEWRNFAWDTAAMNIALKSSEIQHLPS